jgi:3-oxoacyl-[acyl-carrier-protein] synthase-3
MIRARIAGTGRSLPEKIVTNVDLEKIVDTSDSWIRERTGIHERRLLEPGRFTSDLAAEASRQACEAAGVLVAEVDCIIAATVTADMPMPSAGVVIQHKLGLVGVPAFDVAAACAGFLYGLTVGEAFIRGGQFKRVLVIGVEALSRMVDWRDRNTCVLFGDGAGAVLLVPESGDRGILSTRLFADGAQADILNIPGGGAQRPATAESVAENLHVVKMNGREVYRHAVRNLSQASLAALESANLRADQVDWVVAHQANLRILEGVSERVAIPMDKFYVNIHKYGNTSSASVPIALDEAVRQGSIKPGQTVLMTALGAGLAWGAAAIRW